ncbi:MAG: hypothetical protein IJ106_06320 [Parasporobacterium sp.]|nr:hypothetical protein [Parasporobacterium sp.]
MEVKKVITIPARGSGPAGSPSHKNRKQDRRISVDYDRIQKLSEQLTDLVEELDDIREDLKDMLSEMEDSFDSGAYDEDADASEPMDKMEDICSSVDSAFEELNEALDGMEELK